MSQDEVLRCLVQLGGSGSYDQLVDVYNHMHFPRNTDYKIFTQNEVKKILQKDTAKLFRDRMITREYKKPKKRDPYRQYRKYGFYEITTYGYNYINTYQICKPLGIKK